MYFTRIKNQFSPPYENNQSKNFKVQKRCRKSILQSLAHIYEKYSQLFRNRRDLPQHDKKHKQTKWNKTEKQTPNSLANILPNLKRLIFFPLRFAATQVCYLLTTPIQYCTWCPTWYNKASKTNKRCKIKNKKYTLIISEDVTVFIQTLIEFFLKRTGNHK